MKVKLESFLQEVSEKTTENNQYQVLTSSKVGLYLQSDYFNKQVASKDNKGYKIIKKGQFTYRAMSDTGEFFPNMLECTDIGIVSPAYPVFEIVKPVIIPEYLKYYFKSNGFQQSISSFAQGSTRTSIKYGKLKTVSMDLPNLEEQKRVIAILDTIHNIIDSSKQELKMFDDLIKARFVEMFGNITTGNYKYHTKKLGDVANVGSSHRVFTTEFVESGIPFYRGTEIGELASGIKPTEPYYISEEHYNRLANDDTKPQIGDLLMPSICNKGQVWMVDTDEPFYYKDGRVLCISPDREVFDTKYLEYFMRAKTLVEYPKIGSGSTFAEFKIFLLKDIDVSKVTSKIKHFTAKSRKYLSTNQKLPCRRHWAKHKHCLIH